jgi:dihydrofolate reductase
MIVSLIVAAAENGVIGKDNKLPWSLPDDLRHFRALTKGHPIIMGRKTYESIGRPLPDRRNIVLTSTKKAIDGVEVTADLPGLLTKLEKELPESEEVFIIGGSDLFTQWLEDAFVPFVAGKVYLTRVHADINGDATFPDLDDDRWKVVERIEHKADETHAHPFTFETYERV